MCDILDLSGYVNCLILTANQALRLLPPWSCQYKTEHLDMKQHPWLRYPAAYNVSKEIFAETVKQVVTVNLTQPGPICHLGGPSYVMPFNAQGGATLPIVFQKKYKALLRLAKLALGIITTQAPVDPTPKDREQEEEYAVVHWRRGDQTIRCSIGEDTSVNCNSPEELISKVRQILKDGKYEHRTSYDQPSTMFHREKNPKPIDPNKPPRVVYIATNESNSTILSLFEKAGFKTFKHLVKDNVGLPRTMSSLDQFIIELQMMIDADYYLAWGVSSIHDFVRAAYTVDTTLEHSLHPERYKSTPRVISSTIPDCRTNVTNILADYVQGNGIFELLPHEIKKLKSENTGRLS